MERSEIKEGKTYLVTLPSGDEEVVTVTAVENGKYTVETDDGEEYQLRPSKFREEKKMAKKEDNVTQHLEDIEDQLEKLEERVATLEKGKKHPDEVVLDKGRAEVIKGKDKERPSKSTSTTGDNEEEIEKTLKLLKKAKTDGDDVTARKLRKKLRDLGYSLRSQTKDE